MRLQRDDGHSRRLMGLGVGSRYKILKALWHVLWRITLEITYGGRNFEPFEVSGVLVVGSNADLLGTINGKRI